MNRDTILAATGRELDCLFATLIGWTWTDSNRCKRVDLAPAYSTAGWDGIGLTVDEMERRGWGICYTDMRPHHAASLRQHSWSFFKLTEQGGYEFGPDNTTNCVRAACLALLAEREAGK